MKTIDEFEYVKESLMILKERCYWEYRDYDTNKQGIVNKWIVMSDCDHEITMTRDNKYGKIYKQASIPYSEGTGNGTSCPFCSKEVHFYNPYSD